MLIRLLCALIAIFFHSAALAQAEPLPFDKAFQLSARALDANNVEVRVAIADGYYLYKTRFKFAAEPDTIKPGTADLPKGIEKDDDQFGKVETYREFLKFRLPVSGAQGEFKLKVTAQGCADLGICYPPTAQTVTVAAASASSASANAAEEVGSAAESSKIQKLLHQGSLWAILASFFGAGLLLAATPCVFPMIPIISGIIVGQGHGISKTRAFALSAAYVLAMAVTYAVAGVAAGLSGTLLSSALQNAWVLGGFALIFCALALSMFGFYELQLPSFLQSRLSETSAHQKGGSLGGVAVMGVLSALIVGPCVAAPLAGALLYIAQTKNAVLGGFALFSLGLGMGLPLILVGVFSRHLLPHSGPWMEGVKKAFGVIMLALALWLVSPVVPAAALMIGAAAIMIFSAIYLHALDPLPPHAHGWQRFFKGLGVILLLVGAALVIGVMAGSRDILQPLAVLRTANAQAAHPGLSFKKIASVAELDAEVARASQENKAVMLDFYADWCVSCKEMEKLTFTDPGVQDSLRSVVLLQADVTANNASDVALLKRFSLFGPPGIIFFQASGKEVSTSRVIGFEDAAVFVTSVKKALNACALGQAAQAC